MCTGGEGSSLRSMMCWTSSVHDLQTLLNEISLEIDVWFTARNDTRLPNQPRLWRYSDSVGPLWTVTECQGPSRPNRLVESDPVSIAGGVVEIDLHSPAALRGGRRVAAQIRVQKAKGRSDTRPGECNHDGAGGAPSCHRRGNAGAGSCHPFFSEHHVIRRSRFG